MSKGAEAVAGVGDDVESDGDVGALEVVDEAQLGREVSVVVASHRDESFDAGRGVGSEPGGGVVCALLSAGAAVQDTERRTRRSNRWCGITGEIAERRELVGMTCYKHISPAAVL